MRALAKTAGGEGHLEVVDIPEPEPEADGVLIDVAAAGVCGSDLGIYHHEDAYRWVEFPLVLGHEYAGEVIAVGDRVTDVAVGDRVVEHPVRTCGRCYQCRTGARHLCQDARYPGAHEDGAFAERIAAPADGLVAVPDGLPLRHAAVTEPVGVAVRAVTHNSDVTAGDTVLVQGPGPIGLLTALISDRQGGDVLLSGVAADADYRLPNAADQGLDSIDASTDSVADRAPDRGFDVVFDATGHPSGLATAAENVRKGGQVVVIGQTGRAEVDVSAYVRAEVDLQCTYSAGVRELERAMNLLRDGGIDPEQLIDRWATLDGGPEVFEVTAAGELVKPVFELNG
jgi:L-iditol 2-dehydrogenase